MKTKSLKNDLRKHIKDSLLKKEIKDLRKCIEYWRNRAYKAEDKLFGEGLT